MKMNLQTFFFICGGCGKEYEALELPSSQYGQLSLRCIPSNRLLFLDALNDPVYEEVAAILTNIRAAPKEGTVEFADILHGLFHVACDKPQGEKCGIGTEPVCTYCGHNVPTSWRESSPPVLTACDVPSVTHNEWDGLSKEQKVKRVKAALGAA